MNSWGHKLWGGVLISSLLSSMSVFSDQNWEQRSGSVLQQLQVVLQTGGGATLLVGGSLTALLAAGMWTGACFTTAADLLCPEPWTQVKAVGTCVLGLLIAWWGWQLLRSSRAARRDKLAASERFLAVPGINCGGAGGAVAGLITSVTLKL